MAERRMFAKTIIDSDAFLDMPITARLLYYDLAMRADDDGFVNSPKKIMRIVGASQDDLRILAIRKFIIPFESGIVVIKHWRIHNYIRKDTYNETKYKEERALLELDENGAYRQMNADASTDRQLAVDDSLTQVSIGKVSKGKVSTGKVSTGKGREFIPPTLEDVKAYCKERSSPVDPQKFFDYFTAGGWKDAKGNPVRNWKQKLLTWEQYQPQPSAQQKTTGNPFLRLLEKEGLK